jgi:hypothetical protein
MIDLSAYTPYVVAFLVLGCLAAALATATLARLAYDARTPRSRPVVLITTERSASRVAA